MVADREASAKGACKQEAEGTRHFEIVVDRLPYPSLFAISLRLIRHAQIAIRAPRSGKVRDGGAWRHGDRHDKGLDV